MKKKLTIALLAVAVALAANALIAAAQPGPGADPGPGALAAGHGRMWERLDLTDAQRDALKAMRAETQAAHLAVRKDLMRLRNELDGEMLADSPDIKKVEKLSAEIGALRAKLHTGRLLHEIEMRKLLTPEQRDKLLAMRGEHGFGRGGPHAERGRDGWRGQRGACRHDGRGPRHTGDGPGVGRGHRCEPRPDCPRADDD